MSSWQSNVSDAASRSQVDRNVEPEGTKKYKTTKIYTSLQLMNQQRDYRGWYSYPKISPNNYFNFSNCRHDYFLYARSNGLVLQIEASRMLLIQR